MEVGVRELKQRLSEYLDRASKGEIIQVTDRGVPKAVLGPLPGRLRIEEGIAEGWITPASEPGPLPRANFEPVTPLRPSEEVLTEDREDRF
jgi:prevent-host-death family protein